MKKKSIKKNFFICNFHVFTILLFLSVVPSYAKVVGIEITSRQVFAEGMKFGSTGAYEKIKGKLHYAVNPEHPANLRIVDLKYGPRDEKGLVRFSGDFILLKPIDLKKGNQRLFFDVNNRGNLVALGTLNDAAWSNDPATAAHAGNGFLMRQGYTVLWSAWNWDVRPGGGRMQFHIPIAKRGSKFIRQKIAAEIVLSYRKEKSKNEPITWGDSRGYPVLNMKDRKDVVLTVRDEPGGKRRVIPHSQWQLGRLEEGRVIADPTYIYMEPGFEPGKIYELVYTAQNPRIVGLGLAAVRDAISFFRFEVKDAASRPNPLTVKQGGSSLKPDPEKAYIFGLSQSGRFITHMIYQGFHVDEAGRMVIDGARIHVAGAGKGGFNHRFARPTHISSHLEGNYMPGDFFPFNFTADSLQVDPLTGEKGDVLAAAKKLGKIPYIMITNNETEYWTRSASLIHTDVLGKKDAAVHANVRIYLTCGAAHYSTGTRDRFIFEHSQSLIYHYPISRALLAALDRWVTEGKEPPASNYPRIDRGELLSAAEHKKGFPKIPGMRHPGRNLQPARVNYGSKFRREGIITVVPPAMGEPYKTLVPNFDSDGNSIGGIRLPELRVPLGTYQGWNPRQAKYGAPQYLARFEGSFWPFAVTEAEGKKTSDPRPSLEARYAAKEVYVEKVVKAVKDLIKEGFLLEEDGQKYIEEAQKIAWPPEPINFAPYWKQEGMKERKAVKVDPKIYDDYVGQYKIQPGVIVYITKENGRLFFRVNRDQKLELFPESKTKYFIQEGDMELFFKKDNEGKVVKLIIHMRGAETPAPKIK